MRIKTISCFVLAGMLALNSCVKGDIDELQNQIDDLNGKVDDLEQTQQQALLAAIASLESDLASLNSELVADLELLEEEIATNNKAVYYGNVITEDDYAAFTTQGATIITGKVVVGGDAHVAALANVKLIGKSLEINDGGTITMDALQSIGEDLLVNGLSNSASINFTNLSSVGGDVEFMNNDKLTSINANELVLISGGLITEHNLVLATLSLAKLDQVGEISIYEYDAEDFDSPAGALAMLDLSTTNVNGDVEIEYLGAVENLILGDIQGDFIVEKSEVAKITIEGTIIGGAFVLNNNTKLKIVETANLKRIEGELAINSNNGSWDAPDASLNELPSFPVLEYIGGDLTVSGNTGLTTFDAFNAVEEIAGTEINFNGNGNLTNMDVLNALTTVSNASVFVYANTNWFKGFAEVEDLRNVTLSISLPLDDGGFGISSTNSSAGALSDVLKMEGFDKLVKSNTLQLLIGDVTEFNAFGSYTFITDCCSDGFVLNMPKPEVQMCTMEVFLNNVVAGSNGLDWKPVKFTEKIEVVESWGSWFNTVEVERVEAATRLLAACAI